MRGYPALIPVLRPVVGAIRRFIARCGVVPRGDAGVMRAACPAQRIVTTANIVAKIVKAEAGSGAKQRIHQVVLIGCVRPASDRIGKPRERGAPAFQRLIGHRDIDSDCLRRCSPGQNRARACRYQGRCASVE